MYSPALSVSEVCVCEIELWLEAASAVALCHHGCSAVGAERTERLNCKLTHGPTWCGSGADSPQQAPC